jgi:hypothetical protein
LSFSASIAFEAKPSTAAVKVREGMYDG